MEETHLKILPLFFCLILLLFSASAQALTYDFQTSLTQCNVLAPDVIFSAGTNGTAYVISTNKTRAEVNVTGTLETTYYKYVLNITNLSSSVDYQLKLEITSTNGISRLANFTAYFHDGTTSKQVEISNGTVSQSMGSWYSVTASVTIYLSLAIKVSASGESTVDLRLHVVRSDTTSPELTQTVKINVS
jgi:hypothetical protein